MIILDLNNSKTFLDTTEKLRSGLKAYRPKYLHISKINMKNILELFNQIFRSKYIISMSPSPLNIPSCMVSKILNQKFFVGLQDIIPHEGKKQTRTKIYNFLLTKFAYKIVLFSRFSYEQAKKYYKLPEDKLLRINLALPIYPEISNLERKYDFALIGRLDRYKGVEEFIELAKKFPNYNFLLSGELIMEDEIEDLENVDRFFYRHDFSKYIELICSTKILILPYKSATQSGVLLDALFAKTFVIARDVGAMKEQIEIYRNGVLYNDFSELVDFVKNIESFSAFKVSENDLSLAKGRIEKQDISLLRDFEKSLFD